MATADSDFFEIQRRGYQWNRYSTLDDGTTSLNWDGDPNLAVSGHSPGETKLVSMPIGAFFVKSDGVLYFKKSMPNVWVIVGTAAHTTPSFETYAFTDALEWIVTHNRNTRVFNETLTDSFGNRFYAPIQVLDNNSFKVNFTSATSGTIDVIFPS